MTFGFVVERFGLVMRELDPKTRSLFVLSFHASSLIGVVLDSYVRISKQEQHEALQIDALKEAGCEKWFVDEITGSKAERKGLDEARAMCATRGHLDRLELGSSRPLVDPLFRYARASHTKCA
jgi:hypothetical protein